jgi:hypothetical protein
MDQENTSSIQEPQIVIPGPSSVPLPLAVQYTPRRVMVISVTSSELDTVAALNNSVHLGFFGLSLGSAIAFGTVLATSSIPDARTHATFVALLAVSMIGSTYFGIRAFIDYLAAKKKQAELKLGNA